MLKYVVHDLYIIILKEKSPFILLQCRICIAELSRDKTTFLSDFPKEIVFQSRRWHSSVRDAVNLTNVRRSPRTKFTAGDSGKED